MSRMGGVEVLNPQDFLKDTFSRQTLISPPSMKAPRNPNPNRAKRAQPNRRKRSPSRSNSVSPPTRAVANKVSGKNVVMGQVKILKRGEELSQTASDKSTEAADKQNLGEPDLVSTERLVPDLIQLTESTVVIPGLYAGSSAFIASPPPSSLPLPAFFMKKSVAAKTDDATSDLRRILRLDCLD